MALQLDFGTCSPISVAKDRGSTIKALDKRLASFKIMSEHDVNTEGMDSQYDYKKDTDCLLRIIRVLEPDGPITLGPSTLSVGLNLCKLHWTCGAKSKTCSSLSHVTPHNHV